MGRDHEEVSVQNLAVVIPEQDLNAEAHAPHEADCDHHPELFQYPDAVKNLFLVATFRLTLHNNFQTSNQLAPVGYDDLEYQKKLIKESTT